MHTHLRIPSASEDTQLRYADRFDRLILVMYLALYVGSVYRPVGRRSQSNSERKKFRRSVQESRPKQNLLVHPRVSPHRQGDAILPAAGTTLGRAFRLLGAKE
jgi:hypothetical protein